LSCFGPTPPRLVTGANSGLSRRGRIKIPKTVSHRHARLSDEHPRLFRYIERCGWPKMSGNGDANGY
jgi:hypothetical protein